MREGVEEEIENFYRGPYQKPGLGSRTFTERVIEELGGKARVERGLIHYKSMRLATTG